MPDLSSEFALARKHTHIHTHTHTHTETAAVVSSKGKEPVSVFWTVCSWEHNMVK